VCRGGCQAGVSALESDAHPVKMLLLGGGDCWTDVLGSWQGSVVVGEGVLLTRDLRRGLAGTNLLP
jgi:hypothetical protein